LEYTDEVNYHNDEIRVHAESAEIAEEIDQYNPLLDRYSGYSHSINFPNTNFRPTHSNGFLNNNFRPSNPIGPEVRIPSNYGWNRRFSPPAIFPPSPESTTASQNTILILNTENYSTLSTGMPQFGQSTDSMEPVTGVTDNSVHEVTVPTTESSYVTYEGKTISNILTTLISTAAAEVEATELPISERTVNNINFSGVSKAEKVLPESTTSFYIMRHNLPKHVLPTRVNTSDHHQPDIKSKRAGDGKHVHAPEDHLVSTPVGDVDVHEVGLIMYLLLIVCLVLVISLCVVGGYWIKAKCEIRRLDTKMRRACLQGLENKNIENCV